MVRPDANGILATEEEGMIYLSTDPGFAATFAGSRYGAKTIPVYVSATNVAV